LGEGRTERQLVAIKSLPDVATQQALSDFEMEALIMRFVFDDIERRFQQVQTREHCSLYRRLLRSNAALYHPRIARWWRFEIVSQGIKAEIGTVMPSQLLEKISRHNRAPAYN
jgi:hypothetical protein